ncbi:hypothetical protein DBB36_05375 [Flavobacterium sp. WLB]|uniref:hypothetical protein n=1 Tax=unclassified Flavobacterium TaxID=196869 RepID=UPI0006ABBCBF|nr:MULTISPECIES: hypothetical protein [unclassified Flavobacterium]KOP37267.1 hypothetical protein AKO67_16005 [Flavobacterium sp. VMW]OWU88783.1 hypothetical protein APR43_21325 [Flavobacterium sp. NLM]PUU71073.1 hypothetical protein DBB36_05375 [Flavobacterium sp. WLB]
MKLSKFIFITLILLSSFGCKKKEVPESNFEKDVLNSVFVEIVDSIYMDRRIISPPPPPRFNEKTNKVDTTGQHKELKEYWHYRDSIKNDRTRILIGVYDTITKISSLETEMIQKEIDLSSYKYDTIKNAEEYTFDLTPFKNNKKFHFEKASKYPHEKDWNLNDISNSLIPLGTVFISRIQFNKTKTKGVLTAGASCGGGKCGRGFLIIIENKNGKWKVSKIIHTWDS